MLIDGFVSTSILSFMIDRMKHGDRSVVTHECSKTKNIGKNEDFVL